MRFHRMTHAQKVGVVLILGTWGLASFHLRNLWSENSAPENLWSLWFVSTFILCLGFQIFLGAAHKSLWWGNILLHFAVPIFGPFFIFVLILALVVSPKMELLSDFHEEDAALAIKKHDGDPKSYGESMRYNLNVEPLVETIRSKAGTDLKRGAIEMLSKMRTPHAVSLLKECLSDSNSEVRFYASSGLSRIEESLNERIIKYKKIVQNHAEPSSQDVFFLGKAYYEFIYLSVQDEASLQYYLKQATINFEKAFKINPNDLKIVEQLERAYTRSGRHEEARQLKNLVQLGEHQNLMYQAESWYNEKKFKKCKEVLNDMSNNLDPAQERGPVAEVLAMWGIAPQIIKREGEHHES